MSQQKIYEQVTERMISLLEKGVAPWQKSWKSGKAGIAKNIVSKKPYRGVNFFIVNSMGYSSQYWGTYKQIASKGGQVKKGEKGTVVVFWKPLDIKEKQESGEVIDKTIPFLRLSHVFNVEQCEGLKAEENTVELVNHEPIAECEKIRSGFPLGMPEIRHNMGRAFYNPSLDFISLPDKGLFEKAEEYYQTMFHECVHATGHKSRLNRKTLNDIHYKGDANYSQEELVAEMGASFLAAVAGIDSVTVDNSASYLEGWIRALKSDSKIVVKAAAQAQKAVDYLLQTKFEVESD